MIFVIGCLTKAGLTSVANSNNIFQNFLLILPIDRFYSDFIGGS